MKDMPNTSSTAAPDNAGQWIYTSDDVTGTLTNGNWTLNVTRAANALTVTGSSDPATPSALPFSDIISGGGDALTITGIGERAFKYCTNLTSVTLPDSVTHIGHRVFKHCPLLPPDIQTLERFPLTTNH